MPYLHKNLVKVFSLVFILVTLVLLGSVKAETLDLECQRRKLLNPNIDCETDYANLPNRDLDETRSFLFFESRYDGNIDNIPELVRMGFIIFFMIVAIALLFLGIRGMFLYSTAQENDEQIQTAQKIFKNALIGLIIVLFSIVIVQVVAGVFGVADGMFDFSFDISSSVDNSFKQVADPSTSPCNSVCTTTRAQSIVNTQYRDYVSRVVIQDVDLYSNNEQVECRISITFDGSPRTIVQSLNANDVSCTTTGSPILVN